MSTARRTSVRIGAVASAGLILVGLAITAWPHRVRTVTEPPPAPLPSPAAVAAAPPIPGRCARPPANNWIVIPALCVRAALETTFVDATDLVLPPDVTHVFEWNGSASLTAPQGTTLMAAHVHYGALGDGVFSRLAQVRPGAEVMVGAQRRVTHWRVVSVRAYPKAELPHLVWAGDRGPRRLVLVTCGGPVLPDGSGYADNVVVIARPDTTGSDA